MKLPLKPFKLIYIQDNSLTVNWDVSGEKSQAARCRGNSEIQMQLFASAVMKAFSISICPRLGSISLPHQLSLVRRRLRLGVDGDPGDQAPGHEPAQAPDGRLHPGRQLEQGRRGRGRGVRVRGEHRHMLRRGWEIWKEKEQ